MSIFIAWRVLKIYVRVNMYLYTFIHVHLLLLQSLGNKYVGYWAWCAHESRLMNFWNFCLCFGCSAAAVCSFDNLRLFDGCCCVACVLSDPEKDKVGLDDTTALLCLAVFIVSCPTDVVCPSNLLSPSVDQFLQSWQTGSLQVGAEWESCLTCSFNQIHWFLHLSV